MSATIALCPGRGDIDEPTQVVAALLRDTQRHDVGVLHYDGDCDILSEKTGLSFESVWLSRPGHSSLGLDTRARGLYLAGSPLALDCRGVSPGQTGCALWRSHPTVIAHQSCLREWAEGVEIGSNSASRDEMRATSRNASALSRGRLA